MKAVDQNFTSLVGGQALVEEDQGLPLFLRLDQVQQAGLIKLLKTGSAQPKCNPRATDSKWIQYDSTGNLVLKRKRHNIF